MRIDLAQVRRDLHLPTPEDHEVWHRIRAEHADAANDDMFAIWLEPMELRAQDHCRHLVLHEPKQSRLGDAFRVEFGLEGDVELVERLVLRQRGQLEPGGVVAALEHADLAREDEVEQLAVAELALLGAVDELVGRVGGAVGLQLGGVCA